MSTAEMRKTVDVELADRSYRIEVGTNLLATADRELADLANDRKVIIIADQALVGAPLERLSEALGKIARAVHTLTVPAGESSKSFAEFERLTNETLAIGIDRKSLIVAFGGGVIGDLAGFVAAVTLRGLDVVQIPTTLLSQVDSSVGGKTAINTSYGKNLVGAFHQPVRVLIDLDMLDTLPRRELLAGYAEVLKYGAIGDLDFFEWLESNGQKVIDGDKAAQLYAVVTSCEAKARVVAADERESGQRALLNFGHTFGHALEAMAGYDGTLLHGEAVGAGMVLAGQLSTLIGRAPGQDTQRLEAHIRAVGLPASLNEVNPDGSWSADALIGHMAKDKKVRDGQVVFVVLDRLGEALVDAEVDMSRVRELLTRS